MLRTSLLRAAAKKRVVTATYAAFDPANKHADIALSNGNLTATKSAGDALRSVRSSIGVATGKHYFEIHVDDGATSPFMVFGVGQNESSTLNTAVGVSPNSWGYYEETGQKYTNNVLSAFGGAWSTGVTIGVALDADSGKTWFSLNGVWQASGNPAAGTNPAFSGLTGEIYAYVSLYRGSADPKHKVTANFGASAFAYSVPSGFRAGLYQ